MRPRKNGSRAFPTSATSRSRGCARGHRPEARRPPEVVRHQIWRYSPAQSEFPGEHARHQGRQARSAGPARHRAGVHRIPKRSSPGAVRTEQGARTGAHPAGARRRGFEPRRGRGDDPQIVQSADRAWCSRNGRSGISRSTSGWSKRSNRMPSKGGTYRSAPGEGDPRSAPASLTALAATRSATSQGTGRSDRGISRSCRPGKLWRCATSWSRSRTSMPPSPVEIAAWDGPRTRMIERDDMVVTVTHGGYIKRTPLSTFPPGSRWRPQRHGDQGRGCRRRAVHHLDAQSGLVLHQHGPRVPFEGLEAARGRPADQGAADGQPAAARGRGARHERTPAARGRGRVGKPQHRVRDRAGHGPPQFDGFVHQRAVERQICDGLRRGFWRPVDRRRTAERRSGSLPRQRCRQGHPILRIRCPRNEKPHRHRRARHGAEGRCEGCLDGCSIRSPST